MRFKNFNIIPFCCIFSLALNALPLTSSSLQARKLASEGILSLHVYRTYNHHVFTIKNRLSDTPIASRLIPFYSDPTKKLLKLAEFTDTVDRHMPKRTRTFPHGVIASFRNGREWKVLLKRPKSADVFNQYWWDAMNAANRADFIENTTRHHDKWNQQWLRAYYLKKGFNLSSSPISVL